MPTSNRGKRNYWTLGTRDLRALLGVELKSADCARAYREEQSLPNWVIVNVRRSGHGPMYSSPELPNGGAIVPAAGHFAK